MLLFALAMEPLSELLPAPLSFPEAMTSPQRKIFPAFITLLRPAKRLARARPRPGRGNAHKITTYINVLQELGGRFPEVFSEDSGKMAGGRETGFVGDLGDV